MAYSDPADKKAWEARNPERLREYGKRYRSKVKRVRTDVDRARDKAKYAANPEKWRDAALRKKYGMTLEQYRAMYERQCGLCAICGEANDRPEIDLAVDHCHATGKVRALLCASCNVGLGMFKDRRDLLAKADQYLEQHR